MTGADEQRRRMVAEQIEARGIRDPRLLAAMRAVPREAFLPCHLAAAAFADHPVPIGCGQTISQPYMVALMIRALRLAPGERVLEVGTGSGYAAAVLAEMGAEVFTIERSARLAARARRVLRRLGFTQIEVRVGDGSLGWPERAPFDAILVSAGAPRVPPSLTRQLAVGGRMVIPVGAHENEQVLACITRGPDDFEREDLGAVRFVPLRGAEGW
jgi:protein-L-isoaspartate(D-aspartate) O-methyltransferase